MKRFAAGVVIVALQLGLLAYIVFERESTLRTGEVVYLRTMPIDPRDPFRGDYVALNYEINQLPQRQFDEAEGLKDAPAGTAVYAVLDVDARRVAHIVGVSRTKPEQGLYIRGRLPAERRWLRNAAPGHIAIKYGVEKFFVPQGSGLDIEKRRGERLDWQTPMEVAVALNSSGTAVIRDYRWSPVSTKLEDLTERPTDRTQARVNNPSPHLRLSVRNDGDSPVAFVLDSDGCEFSLEPIDGEALEMLADTCGAWRVDAAEIKVIQPGEVLLREFKFEELRWHIRRQDFSGEMGKLSQWLRLRLVYRPASADQFETDVTADQRALLWSSTLLTPAFSNQGRID